MGIAQVIEKKGGCPAGDGIQNRNFGYTPGSFRKSGKQRR